MGQDWLPSFPILRTIRNTYIERWAPLEMSGLCEYPPVLHWTAGSSNNILWGLFSYPVTTRWRADQSPLARLGGVLGAVFGQKHIWRTGTPSILICALSSHGLTTLEHRRARNTSSQHTTSHWVMRHVACQYLHINVASHQHDIISNGNSSCTLQHIAPLLTVLHYSPEHAHVSFPLHWNTRDYFTSSSPSPHANG